MNCRFPQRHASKRMFCFHWAGGTPAYYKALSENLTHDLEVITYCLPGRDNRFREEKFTNLKQLIDEIVNLIHEKYWDKPFVFMGHSMGALISFFVAMELRKVHNREPEHMILSGAVAPNVPDVKERRPNPKHLSKDEFMKGIQALGGTPPEFTKHPELIDLFYPIICSDCGIIEEMVYHTPTEPNSPLTCSVDYFYGETDQDNFPDYWKKLTCGSFTAHKMTGGHFFLMEPKIRQQLINFINSKFGDHI